MDSFSHLPPADEQQSAVPSPPFSGNSGHPPYPDMIMSAIGGLDDKEGSSRQAIAKYMEREYSNLPPTHPNLLTHHLKRMKKEGQLIMIKHSYALPPPRSVPFQPPVVDAHFTDYSITPPTDNLTPRRKPGRPPKPIQDFQNHHFHTQTHLPHYASPSPHHVQANYSQPPIFTSLEGVTTGLLSAKRGRGRPPKATANASGSLGDVGASVTGTEGRRKRGRPKAMSIARGNGGVGKRGRPKKIGGIVTVPLSGNVASPRGRPKRVVSRPETMSDDVGSGSVSRGRGRGRPPKDKFRNSFGRPSKVGPGTAVIVTDPRQLVAYQELKLKYEHLQSKAKEVVGVVRPYINPDHEAFGALQELEMLVGTYSVVESEKQPNA